MSALMWLAPMSILLGVFGLIAFVWTFSAGQYDDPDGDAARILLDDDDAPPSPLAASGAGRDPSDAG
jgi:cbb3-type cytochrome oxidase maturation protein